jgi:hypothetical protein
VLIIPSSWGSQLGGHLHQHRTAIKLFSGAVAAEKEDFCKGSFARTPRNIQEVQASKLWDAPKAPLLHWQKSGHLSRHYIFIALCTMCFSWSVSCFCFQFSFVLFAAINGWTPTNFFWRSLLAFHLPRTLSFSLLSFNECSIFLELHLAFVFRLDFCSDLVISLYQGVF